MNYEQNKGITLIALIITIIVMLILAGVTINIIVNGGLFEQAKESAEVTRIRAAEEKAEMLTGEYAMWKETTQNNDKSIVAFLIEKQGKGEGTFDPSKGFYTDSEGTVFAKTSENRIGVVQTETNAAFDLPVILYLERESYAVAEIYPPIPEAKITSIKYMWMPSSTPLSASDSAWASAFSENTSTYSDDTSGITGETPFFICTARSGHPSGITYLHLLVTLEGGEKHVVVKGPIQVPPPTT